MLDINDLELKERELTLHNEDKVLKTNSKKSDFEENQVELNNNNSSFFINTRNKEFRKTINNCNVTQTKVKNVSIKKAENYYSKFYESLANKYRNIYINRELVKNSEILKYKTENKYYCVLEDYYNDIFFMINYLKGFYSNNYYHSDNKNNKESYINPNTNKTLLYINNYLDRFSLNLIKAIDQVFPYDHFKKFYDDDLKLIIKSNRLPKRAENSNYKNIPVGKAYEAIQNYYHTFPEITVPMVKTNLKPDCCSTDKIKLNNDDNNDTNTNLHITGTSCCEDYSKLGPFDLEKGKWKGQCKDKSNNLECDPSHCSCNPNTCKNMEFRNKTYLKLGVDVIQKYSWGIDLYTFRNMMEFLPSNFDEEYKACYVEKVLIVELSNMNEEGYDISKSLKNYIKLRKTELLDSEFSNSDEDTKETNELEDNGIKDKENSEINDNTEDLSILDYLNNKNKSVYNNATYYFNKKRLRNKKSNNLISTKIKEIITYSQNTYSPGKAYDLQLFRRNSYYLSENLIKVKENSTSTETCFTAFCKGLGIFCNRKEGIQTNQLISPYLGEIYPQWFWFEKQDLIKSKNLDKDLPDFYNIQLERLRSDDKGYNLLMVDPNSKGNFPSRMSHCCNPNCQTVTSVSSGEYFIGMYCVKPINYGEELTFDYNSITEKENEFKESICLCGTYNCKGHYLIYSNGNNYNEIINNNHSFLYRNAILLKSSSGFNNSSEKQYVLDYLSENLIGESLLFNCPDWVICWIYFIVQFYNYERQIMPRYRLLINKIEQKGKNNKLNELINKLKLNDSNKNATILSYLLESIKEIHLDDPNTDETNSINNLDSESSIEKNSINNGNDTKMVIDEEMKNSTLIKNDIMEIEINNELLSNSKENIQNNYNKGFTNPTPTSNNNIIEIDSKDTIKYRIDSNNNIREVRKSNRVNKKTTNKNKNIITIDLKTTEPETSMQLKSNTNDKHQTEEYLQRELKKQIKDMIYDVPKEMIYFSDGLKDSRLQNMCITVSKVNHILSLMKKTNEPPLVKLSIKDKVLYYFGNQPSSIKVSLLSSLVILVNKANSDFNSIVIEIIELLNDSYLKKEIYNIEKNERREITSLQENKSSTTSSSFNNSNNSKSINEESVQTELTKKHFEEILILIVFKLRQVAKLLYKLSKFECSYNFAAFEQLSVVLSLIINTKFYFKPNPNYPTPDDSVEISILKRDICLSGFVNEKKDFTEEELNQVVVSGKKKYDKLHIWGQMIGWYKQTVNKPDASLASDRRGTLVYPDIDSFFLSNQSKNDNINAKANINGINDNNNFDENKDNARNNDVMNDKELDLKHNSSNNDSKETEKTDKTDKTETTICTISTNQEKTTKNKRIIKKKSLLEDLYGDIKGKSLNTFQHYGTRKNPPNKYIKTGYSKMDSIFNYPFETTKEKFLEKLSEQPSLNWGPNNRWNYKNRERVYGTINFDSVLMELENKSDMFTFSSVLDKSGYEYLRKTYSDILEFLENEDN